MASSTVVSDLVFQKAISNISFSIYNEVDKSGNEFISPYSITAALLLLMLGTDGTTEEQMMTSIFNGENPENVHQSYKVLNDILLERTQTGVTLAVTNRLFGTLNYPLLGSYMTNSLRYYGSNVELLDYGSNSEQCRDKINSWISMETMNKIHDIIPKGAISIDTVVVLANAIYFKGTWKTQFDPKNTTKRNFFLNQSIQKQVDMMYGEFEATSGENTVLKCKVVPLPYVGDKLSMVFVFPNDENGLPCFEKKLTLATFEGLLPGLRKQDTFIQIPRFVVEAKYDLIPIIKRLGITEIFDYRIANFTKMVSSPVRGLYVSDARHKTYIEVNEEGSEAAAATTVVVENKSMNMPFEFVADRPFIFIIRDNETGTILFIGRFADP